jgi:hypothetical protein
MDGSMGSGFRRAITKMAVAGALIAIPAIGLTLPVAAGGVDSSRMPAPLDLPTNPNDPLCAQMPWAAACQGGPYEQKVPTSPSDPACINNPTNAICQGGPYDLPADAPPPAEMDAPVAPVLPPPPVEAPPPVEGPPILPPPIEAPPIASPPIEAPPIAPPPIEEAPVMAPPPMAPAMSTPGMA